MVLAGGEGKRLYPLTLDRAKPAVPFGGRYRIIDIVLSNFVNSGLARIKVLTQYKSASLEEHIARDWRLSPILDQFIEAIPAQQRTGQDVVPRLGRRRLAVPARHHRRDARARRASSAATTSTRWTCARCSSCHQDDERRRHGRRHPGAARRGAATSASSRSTTTAASSPSTRRSTNPPAMPRQRRHVPRVDGQLRLQARASCCASSSEDDRARGRARTTSATTSCRGMVRQGRRGLRLRLRDERACPARTSATAATGATSGRSTPTGRRRWTSSRSIPQFNLYNFRWPIRTGVTHDPPAKFVFRDEAQRARRHRDRLAWSATAASSPAGASTAASSASAAA